MRTEPMQIDIACAPEHVWHVDTNVVRWPQWTPSITQVEPRVCLQLAFSGPLGLGALLTRTRNRLYLRTKAMGLKVRCEASWRGPLVPGVMHGGADA